MKIIITILLCLAIVKTYGYACDNLVGTWQNDLNSTMTIENVNSFTGYFTGHFYSYVESSPGAQSISSKLSGVLTPIGSSKLIGFNVLFNGGNNIVAFAGQCMECEGKEVLYITFILRFYESAQNRWKSTIINCNTFWKISSEKVFHDTEESADTTKDEVNGNDLRGTWKSPVDKDSFTIKELLGSDRWKGDYHSEQGYAGSAAGIYDGYKECTAIGFVATSMNKIKAWTGYIDQPHTPSRQMHTSWIEHTFINSCRNPRKYVNFGVDSYLKT